jgi:hypothetical protein
MGGGEINFKIYSIVLGEDFFFFLIQIRGVKVDKKLIKETSEILKKSFP